MNKIVLSVLLVVFVLLMPLIHTARSQGQQGADWTLAVYMDSDNNLEQWAQEDVNEMMEVGSTDAVNIIVLWDHRGDVANVHRVLPGELRDLTVAGLSGSEVNMGDPATLRSFVTYVSEAFPADNFALTLWDHGDDFRGLVYDEHTPSGEFDLLTHPEVVTALSGFSVDVLYYGACVMQMIEISYEYAASDLDIDYFVANEGYDPLPGLPFDRFLSRLVAESAESDVGPLEFSKMIVDEYISYYDDSAGKGQSQAVTLSVVDMHKVGKLVQNFTSMTAAMMSDISGYQGIVSKARGRANLPWSENGWEALIDLTMFVQTIHDESLKPNLVHRIDSSVVSSVISSSEAVLDSLSDAIVYHRNTHVMEAHGCYGIGIYFPTSYGSYENNDHIYGSLYELMQFPHQGWIQFLNAHWGVH